MGAELLDRLLTSLAVRLHAFSVCEIQAGWRLCVGPSEAVIIHYVLAGSGAVRSASGPWIPFTPRSVIVVPAHKPHDVGEPGQLAREARSEEHCTLLDNGLVRFTAGDGTPDTLLVCGMISASYAGGFGLFAPLRDPLVEDLSSNGVLQQTFDLLFGEIARPSIGTQAMAESLMKQCLILLLRQHLLHADEASPLFMPLKDQRLARAIMDILEDPAAGHTVESLASAAGMSRAAFADRFAHVYEQTPMDFVQKVRLRIAARLLTTTDLPVKVVASSIGYASRSSFSRVFRGAYGVDPKSFRLMGRDEDREPAPDESKQGLVRALVPSVS